MLFWKEYHEIWEICLKWTKKELETKTEEYQIDLPLDTRENRWAAFGRILGKENHHGDVISSSMGYVLSSFFAGMGVSAGTDQYINEEKVDYAIFDELDTYNFNDDEIKNKQKLLKFIIKFFNSDIEKYEYHNMRIDFYLTASETDKLMNIRGDTKISKLRRLLKFWYDNH